MPGSAADVDAENGKTFIIKRNLHSQNQVRETHDEVNLLREADYESKQ